MAGALHVTNGDAVVPELAAAAGVGPAEVLVWREILHDGPVPAGLDPDELAQVRARHLAARAAHDPTRPSSPADAPGVSPLGDAARVSRPVDPPDLSEADTLAMFRERDRRLAEHKGEVVLWFEDDLFDALLLAQIEDRLAARGNGHVTLVHLRHPPRGDLAAALAAREPIRPDPAAFEALRSPDPRAWTAVPAFARLLEELPDASSGLTRLERQILEALAAGPLAPRELFPAAVAGEDPPWVGDATVFALAAGLDPLVALADGRYELAPAGEAVLAGAAARPPIDRWLGGVHLGPGHPDWRWDPATRRPVLLG